MKNLPTNRLEIVLLLLVLSCCQGTPPQEKKIKGISFVGPVKVIGEKEVLPVNSTNADWVCLMPFAYGGNNKGGLVRELEWQWWGEKPEGVIQCLQLFKKQHKKIMIKPQVWITSGSFTGNFSLEGEEAWRKWEKDYETFILDYAKIAQEWKVELFCIGTEFKKAIEKRPQFWTRLIQKVKTIYSGKLTYAANWDNYHRIPFWKELDYIGIDAYFPLVDNNNPTEKELIQAWKKHKEDIMEVSSKEGKQILFTEIGYRSIDFTAQKPWDSYRNEAVDYEEQNRAYTAMFKTFWNHPKFAGLFIWKWFDYHDRIGGPRHERGYSPQKKPAEAIIKEWFAR